MRRPDINRVRRAAEHLKAAMTNLDSIKWENRTKIENENIERAYCEMYPGESLGLCKEEEFIKIKPRHDTRRTGQVWSKCT